MPSHIVVLGAGYTGLTAAKLAAKRTGATVTLVNQRDRGDRPWPSSAR